MMRRTQTVFDGQERDKKTGNRPVDRKQADRQIKPMRTTGNRPIVRKQTHGQEINL
jgi:hypothetical protein